MIREADALTPDNPFDVRTLDGSHLRWLVHPEPAAELLMRPLRVLTELGSHIRALGPPLGPWTPDRAAAGPYRLCG